MNWEPVESKWHQLKGVVRARWARLTDVDMESIAGKREHLIGKIQERYGVAKEDAEQQVNEWKAAYDTQTVAHRSARKAG